MTVRAHLRTVALVAVIALLSLAAPAGARKCGDTWSGTFNSSTYECAGAASNCSGIVVCAY